MKPGLEYLPQLADLTVAYDALQELTPSRASESDLALYSQWARFDARLAEIWITYVAKYWQTIHPLSLHRELEEQPWPAAAGPLLEFVKHLARRQDRKITKLYKAWAGLVLEGVKPAPWQLFFISNRKPASRAVIADAEYSLQEYRKWGFLSQDVVISKAEQKRSAGIRTHTFSPEVRSNILHRLIQEHARINLSLYLSAVDHSISRRQAERDLSSCPALTPEGKTKARQYRVSGILR